MIKIQKPSRGILLNLDFFWKMVYTKFAKKNGIILAAPIIVKLWIKPFLWAKNDRKNSMRTQKNILKSSSTLYFEKTKKIKASIWSKPEFELQFHFTAETNNYNISWFWYIYLILSIGLWKRSILEIIWYFLDR